MPNKGQNEVVDTIKNTISTAKVRFDSFQENRNLKKEERRRQKQLKELSPMAKNAPGNITGPTFIVFGLIFIGLVLGFAGVNYFLYHRSLSFVLLVFTVPLILSLALLIWGIKQNINAETYSVYRKIFKKKPYASIEELSRKTYQTEYKTIKNLKKFKNQGLYPKGFFTDDKKYFVLSEGALEILDEELHIEQTQSKKDQQIKNLEENYPKLYSIYKDIEEVLTELNSLKNKNLSLRKPQLEDELDELDYNLKQVRDYILDKPEEVPDLKNFLDYFLETLTKLLKTYCELDRSKIQTSNIIESESQIEESLQYINKALVNMYNDFYVGTSMDVYSDIKVLEAMINKQGFADSDFEEKVNYE